MVWVGRDLIDGSSSSVVGVDSFHQTRLLKALSNLALNTSREGAATASVGSLCQCLTTLVVEFLSYIQSKSTLF